MRIVIKIGTSLLTTPDHTLNRQFLRGVIAQIVDLHTRGYEIVIVSSGAVAAGRTQLQFDQEKTKIPYRQALAAVGQPILMNSYRELLALHRIVSAQALLTNYDFVNRENFLNTKNVFETLFEKKVIPIVNENDVTTIAELKFGDNDMLSAKTAAMLSADFLCILTDVEGLYDAHPKKNPDAKLIPVVKKVTEEIHGLAGGTGSGASTGGMITKIAAAEYCTTSGTAVFMVGGNKANVITDVTEYFENYKKSGNIPERIIGTFFVPSLKSGQNGNKKWLRPKIQRNSWIEIDTGAARALTEMGKSLLPSGVISVNGKFLRGDVIYIKFEEKIVGYGQSNYDAQDLDKIKKHRSDEIEAILGFSFEDEVIHRDRMVIERA